jgi:hypothetical protein
MQIAEAFTSDEARHRCENADTDHTSRRSAGASSLLALVIGTVIFRLDTTPNPQLMGPAAELSQAIGPGKVGSQ